jgi:hypothetical protein
VSGGSPGRSSAPPELAEVGIRLVLPREDEMMAGEAVRRRLDALGRVLGQPAAVAFFG